MINTIRKILTGKVFKFDACGPTFVILGVKKDSLYKHNLKILIANLNLSRKRKKTHDCYVMSWYWYEPDNIIFVGRDSKKTIRNCIKRRPDKIRYHIGKTINLDGIQVRDNCNYYTRYITSLMRKRNEIL